MSTPRFAPRFEEVPLRMEIHGPRRVSRRRKKGLKGSYVGLLVAIAIEEYERLRGPDHRIPRHMRRVFRQTRFCAAARPEVPHAR